VLGSVWFVCHCMNRKLGYPVQPLPLWHVREGTCLISCVDSGSRTDNMDDVAYWTKEETLKSRLKLISIWSEDNIQAQLEECKKNLDVWTEVSREMTSAGYSRTYEQCCEKMKKLRTEYKKISSKRNETGQGRYPEWDYFDAMGDVLAHKPSTQPEVVVDALADSQVQNTQTEGNDDDLTEAGSTSNTVKTVYNGHLWTNSL